MAITDFRDLDVYQRTKRLLPIVKSLCLKLARDNRELSKNLIKTSCQIGPVIAEGYAKRNSLSEFKRFLEIAIGSTNEMIAHIEQVELLDESIDKGSLSALILEYEIVAKQLQMLKRNWK